MPAFLLLLSNARTASGLSLQPPSMPPFSPHRGWGWVRVWERTQSGQLTPADHRDIPYHASPCSVIKAEGSTGAGGTLSLLKCLSSTATTTHTEALLVSGWTLPADGKYKINLILLCFYMQALLLSLNDLHLNPWSCPSCCLPLFCWEGGAREPQGWQPGSQSRSTHYNAFT